MTSGTMNIEKRKEKNMARVTLPKDIAAIHGRIGNLIFRSRKQPDGTYKVFVHADPNYQKRVIPRN